MFFSNKMLYHHVVLSLNYILINQKSVPRSILVTDVGDEMCYNSCHQHLESVTNIMFPTFQHRIRKGLQKNAGYKGNILLG